jgi:hypothetical protein
LKKQKETEKKKVKERPAKQAAKTKYEKEP